MVGLGTLEAVADDDPPHGDAGGGSQALKDPHGDQHLDAVGEQRAEPAQREQQRAVDEDRSAPDAVRQRSCDELAYPEHDEKGRQDELRLV